MAVLMFVGNQIFMQYLGNNGVGAFGVCCYYTPFVFMVGNAVAQSVQPIISFNHGISETARVRAAIKTALQTSLLFGLLTTLIFMFFPEVLVGLFLQTENPAAELSISGFPYFAVGFTFFILNLTSIGYFQSLEKIQQAALFAILRGFVFLVPSFILLPKVLGIQGIWLAMPMSECLTFAMISLYYLKQHYQQRMEKK